MTLRHAIVSAFIFIAVIISIFIIYLLFHRPLTHHLDANMEVIGIISPDSAPDTTQHGILNGEEDVLIVDHATLLYQTIVHKIPQAKFLIPEEIFNVNNLHLFDTHSTGILTAQDPLFKHFFILHFYDNGRQNEIKSLSAAGIQGIYINMMPTGNREVLMADGSHRALHNLNRIEKK